MNMQKDVLGHKLKKGGHLRTTENEMCADITRRAVEELQRENSRAKQRQQTMGSLAWKKCPVSSVNKRFLRNLLPVASSPPSRNSCVRPSFNKAAAAGNKMRKRRREEVNGESEKNAGDEMKKKNICNDDDSTCAN